MIERDARRRAAQFESFHILQLPQVPQPCGAILGSRAHVVAVLAEVDGRDLLVMPLKAVDQALRLHIPDPHHAVVSAHSEDEAVRME
eukprot:CAMPEP_0205908608 /NCGR_PEP_ID=MMETSP1325-20131115/3332_1 /ASSEMBLY_ACC=CAM_ASM_000708 /TAXON_ID=236786 /ORGANISM="Florenciella sp., Strain RCC1007" /LENGTH=86 /DNA_ID=CAMNT_0053274833 /DNA_START=105 /DNA_END=362 /DNA_ORIENTATION=-